MSHNQLVRLFSLELDTVRKAYEANNSSPSSAEVNNAWSYTPLPQYVFMASYFLKYRDNFTLPYDNQCGTEWSWPILNLEELKEATKCLSQERRSLIGIRTGYLCNATRWVETSAPMEGPASSWSASSAYNSQGEGPQSSPPEGTADPDLTSHSMQLYCQLNAVRFRASDYLVRSRLWQTCDGTVFL
jgi:hypothetical protein